jgi:diaminopimelate epimerase
VLEFSKYQGLGNDFLMLDGRSAGDSEFVFGLTPELVVQLCDRRFGVGGDGIILALPPMAGGELRMRIFNADGTEPEMCGNGIRCLARFLADRDGDGPGRTWQIDTLAGRIVPQLLDDGTIRVDMGAPFLLPDAGCYEKHEECGDVLDLHNEKYKKTKKLRLALAILCKHKRWVNEGLRSKTPH